MGGHRSKYGRSGRPPMGVGTDAGGVKEKKTGTGASEEKEDAPRRNIPDAFTVFVPGQKMWGGEVRTKGLWKKNQAHGEWGMGGGEKKWAKNESPRRQRWRRKKKKKSFEEKKKEGRPLKKTSQKKKSESAGKREHGRLGERKLSHREKRNIER